MKPRVRERDDLLLLAASLAMVPLGWLLLGWRWPLCVSGYDAWATTLPLLAELSSARGDWSALAYRPDLLGGTRLADSVGPNPLAALLAWGGLDATAVYDLSVFALQGLLGFLAARAGADLAAAWMGGGSTARPPSWTIRLTLAGLAAFAPFLGWRFGYGHLAFTTGLLPFQAALALVAAASAGTFGLTLGVVGLLSVAHGLLFSGYQLIVYGAVFGGPVLWGVWRSGPSPSLRALAAPAAVLLAALAAAWPALGPVLGHGLGSDAPRPAHGLRVTYSYLTAMPLDWISSVPWTRMAIPAGRPPLHHHETNLPLGPALLLLVLVPWRRCRPLAWALGASAALALLFSMDVPPGSLLARLPLLSSFRVPTRALLPLVSLMPILAVAGAWAAACAREAARGGRAWRPGAAVAGPAGFLLLLAAPPAAREALGWALAALLAAWLHPRAARVAGLAARSAAAAVLAALAGGSLGAFGERLLPFTDTRALLARAGGMGERVRAARPELGSPLVRVAPSFELPELGANTAFASGLSSLDGYFFPSRRFVALVCALRGRPYDPTAFVMRFGTQARSARALYQLYDVRFELSRAGEAPARPAGRSVPDAVPLARTTEDPAVEVSALPSPTAGPAWFAAALRPVASYEELAAELLSAGDSLHARARQAAWVVASDPRLPPLPAVDPSCAQALARVVEATRRGRVLVAVELDAPCPLVLATNYAESLEARARVRGSWQAAPTFPACGALLGIWVPGGATEVAIVPR